MKKRFATGLLAITLFANLSYAGIDGWTPKSNLTISTDVSSTSSSTSVQQTTWSNLIQSFWGFLFN